MKEEYQSLVRAQYLELELDAARSESKRRAQQAFEVGLWVGAVLAGTAGLGFGYALGVRSKMTAPADRKDA